MAGLNAGLDGFNNWLKEYYIDRNMLDNLLYGTDPLFSALKKVPATETVQGKEVIVPIKVSRNPNASRDFATSQAASKNRTAVRERFVIKTDEDYAIGRISNVVKYASEGKSGAFINAFKDEMNDAIVTLGQRRSSDIAGSGNSVRGAVGSAPAATARKFTLATKSDISNFDIGMVLVFSNDSAMTGTQVLVAGQKGTIEKVDHDAGTIEFTADLAAVPSDGDLIYNDGDFGKEAMNGLSAWIPDTVAGIGTFHGVDRSVSPQRLAGFRVDGTSGNIETHIRALCAQIFTVTKGSPDTAWMNPVTYNKLVTEMASGSNSAGQIRYNIDGADMVKTAVSGFSGVVIRTAGGPVNVRTSPYLPVDKVYCLKMDSWAIYYISDVGNKFCDFIRNDSGQLWRESHDEPSLEVRAESYGALACNAPGCNGVITGIDITT